MVGTGMARLSKKPLAEHTDQRLLARFWRVFEWCCNRYGVSSFDWPTLRVLYPEEYTHLTEIKAECRKRILASTPAENPVGTFCGGEYDKKSGRLLRSQPA